MTAKKTIHFVGYAGDLGGRGPGSSDGPHTMQVSPFLSDLQKLGVDLKWHKMIHMDKKQEALPAIAKMSEQLALQVNELVHAKQFFTVIGGDHSSGIGTWSGAAHAIRDKGDLGLIWIDAHMDSHTFETTPSGNIHGMPVASLLGHGDEALTHILHKQSKVKPEHLCLIGIRSFEPGESELLNKLNVKIFYMEDIKEKGLDVVMKEAIAIATKNTAGFGVSIDIDSIDPNDAPGTGSLEPDGLSAFELCQALGLVAKQKKLLGIEIAEFDPHRDQNKKNRKVSAIISAEFNSRKISMKTLHVSIKRQEMRLLENDKLQKTYAISSAKNGPGEIFGSEQTPRGWHVIRAKVGANSPANAVFVSRRFTGEIYTPELKTQFPERDWILTRIMWLSGMEKGKNRLGNVDTMRRYVYIHGTPDHVEMGKPGSKGCIRMRNSEIIELFDIIPVGTRILIEE